MRNSVIAGLMLVALSSFGCGGDDNSKYDFTGTWAGSLSSAATKCSDGSSTPSEITQISFTILNTFHQTQNSPPRLPWRKKGLPKQERQLPNPRRPAMLLALSLSRPQRRRLQHLCRKERDHLVVQRARILLLLWERLLVCVIAERLDCSRSLIYRTFQRFQQQGEDSVLDGRSRRAPSKVTPSVLHHLAAYLALPPSDWGWFRSTWTLRLLRVQLHKDTNVLLSLSHLCTLLHRLGFRRLRPRPVLRIPVAERQERLRQLELLRARASPKEEVFCLNEADLDLNPKLGAVWARKGRQPLVLTPGKNQKRYLAAARNVRTGRLTRVWAHHKNSALFVALLEALCRRYRRSKTLHIILDNYTIHKSRLVHRWLSEHSGRVQLHFQPPYTPEANDVEHVWKQLHECVTRNHRCSSMEQLLNQSLCFLDHAQPFPGSNVSLLRLADLAVLG